MNIFEQLDKILNPVNEAEEMETAKEKAERIVKAIPVNPEMETEEQGKQKAWEKLAKYFYKLSMGGSPGDKLTRKDDIDLPDDFLDPKMKGKMSGKIEDKEFEANKVVWDQDEEMEKLEKEIDVDMHGSDDDFDDFDYRDNAFGDDIEQDELDTDDLDGGGSGSGDDSDKSEDEKLRDTIDDALDKMSDSGDLDGDQDGQQGGEQSGSQQGGQEGGQQEGQQGESGEGSGGHQSGNGAPETRKDKRLKELKDAIDNNDTKGMDQAVDGLKEGGDGSGELAGERIGEVSDKDLRGDMSKAGVSEKDIEEMSKASKDNKMSELSEDEARTLKKQVADGLEKKCEGKGGSALAKTVVKNALRSKVNDDEWRSMLKLFLKSKSVNNGNMSKTRNGIKFGHKNHLWRDAMLPTKGPSRGTVQTIYCFVDFSGSVEQDLVYTFLGRVIDLCEELSYTDIVVYGFGEHIVLPRKINGRMLKRDGKDVVLAQTWDYINSQRPGAGTENFEDVANEIMEIRKRQRDAVYLIFGDALWQDPRVGPMRLKYICGDRLLDRMCVLTYYDPDDYWFDIFKGCISMLKELVGLKNVITTKTSRIRMNKTIEEV